MSKSIDTIQYQTMREVVQNDFLICHSNFCGELDSCVTIGFGAEAPLFWANSGGCETLSWFSCRTQIQLAVSQDSTFLFEYMYTCTYIVGYI